MTRSTKKKAARTKSKTGQKQARRVGARLTKTANGEPPAETRFRKGESDQEVKNA